MKKKKRRVQGLKLTKENITVLGFEVNTNYEQMCEDNMVDRVQKMRQIFRLWSVRNLSLNGRVNIAMTLEKSLLTYHIMNLEMPENGLRAIEQIVYEYIWQGKRRAKINIKKNTLIWPI